MVTEQEDGKGKQERKLPTTINHGWERNKKSSKEEQEEVGKNEDGARSGR